MLKKIFSIRNSADKRHKIITLFGLKFSFRVYEEMKLGIAYNLFGGEELLESSVKSVRSAADYICVVYQKKSYYGNDANPNIENILNNLKSQNLIDEIYLYERDFNLKKDDKKFFEREKRDIGLKLCKKAGMTHFLSMDVDEFYESDKINKLKTFIAVNKINSTACSIYEYLKTPEYMFLNSYTYKDNDDYNFYVPFIMKIHGKKQHHSYKFQTYVDPTRALNGDEKFYLFPVQDVVMHHMCSVRKNLDKKYKNSTYIDGGEAYVNKINKIQEDILKWNPDENRIGNSEYYLFNGSVIKKVNNKFNIYIDK